jgi:hypothetical protein
MKAALAVFAILASATAPALPKQEQEQEQEMPEPPERPSESGERAPVIDILAPVTSAPIDERDYEECLAEQDAAQISGEIIVCRKLGDDAEFSGVDSEAATRRYAERTQGPGTPDVEGAGGSLLYRTEGSVFMVTVKTKTGDPPPPALIIDVEALPDAPEGSDADRVGKSLPVDLDGPR